METTPTKEKQKGRSKESEKKSPKQKKKGIDQAIVSTRIETNKQQEPQIVTKPPTIVPVETSSTPQRKRGRPKVSLVVSPQVESINPPISPKVVAVIKLNKKVLKIIIKIIIIHSQIHINSSFI